MRAGCVFFSGRYICGIVFGLFDTKIKQLWFQVLILIASLKWTKIPIKTPFSTPPKHLKLRIDCCIICRTIGLFCRTIDLHSAAQFSIFGCTLSESLNGTLRDYANSLTSLSTDGETGHPKFIPQPNRGWTWDFLVGSQRSNQLHLPWILSSLIRNYTYRLQCCILKQWTNTKDYEVETAQSVSTM